MNNDELKEKNDMNESGTRKTVFSVVCSWLTVFTLPIRKNPGFFSFMYVLGIVCAWLTLPKTQKAHVYENLYLELFFDLYLLCAILTLIPHVVRRWVKVFLAVLLFVVAVADVYCYTKFGSTLNPTMLMLVGETNPREAGEFLSTFLTWEMLWSVVGILFILPVVFFFVVWLLRKKGKPLLSRADKILQSPFHPILSLIVLVLLIYAGVQSWPNKEATHRLMTLGTIGKVEHELTRMKRARLYLPIYRLAFSLRANALAGQQIQRLKEATAHLQVDSCSYRSPNIVLIIGESFGPHHSQQYGYAMPTTPRQIKRENSGLLTKFTDVVAPWNLTSFVFKYMLSTHVIGQEGEWCDYPLFPQLFRKAGYKVTFLTNQFLPKAKQEVYDFSGGFFINDPELSRSMFDIRNTTTYPYDDGLLAVYDSLASLPSDSSANLYIFHLIGQHMDYYQRCPKDRYKFKPENYDKLRPDLKLPRKKKLAFYDNAVLYNDSIVDEICRRFEHQNAIVMYMPDHGEECYEPGRNIICRNHSARVTYDLARYEFAIPFWIWCSPEYAHKNPEIYHEIVAAKHRRFMTDALPHMLLYLAGISCPYYQAACNLLSPEYDENRPRLLKATVDYDKLKLSNNDRKDANAQ